MSYQTLQVEWQEAVCTARIHRPEASNAINGQMVDELHAVLTACEQSPQVTVLVLTGSAQVFCSGGDFEAIHASAEAPPPEPLFDLWARMATATVVVVSVARGRVNAGGIGFLCASDIVLADRSTTCGLSELLFGLFPAMVLPFLIRRIGLQKANYLTLMTRPIGVDEALSIGLVDAVEDDAQELLRKHLLRLRRLSKPAIERYKSYLAHLTGEPERSRETALAANRDLFRNPEIQRNIRRYVTEAKFPWES
jgi:polyketide biosynthesis enoyl-CoA hydratase PksH